MENPRSEPTGKTVAAKDPGTGHFYISVVKSVIRIAGCAVALFVSVKTAIIVMAAALIIAELLGIAEELVD